jgi:hypothetical protein
MFGKDKVKGHNRIIKGKSGFKVTRIGDFLRKKDDNSKRNLAIGVGAVGILGVGTALLLKKKGMKFPGQMAKKNSLANNKVNENVVVPKNNSTITPGEKFIKEMDEDFGVLPTTTKPKVSKQVDHVIEDPWTTPIKTKINKSIDIEIKSKSKDIPLLTGKKVPANRDNLFVFDNRTTKRVTKKAASDAVRINSMEKTYKSISPDNLAMKASIKIDHYLKRPRKTSSLGAPPKPTSLEEVISNPNINQAQKKVEDRLARAERQLDKKSKTLKKN